VFYSILGISLDVESLETYAETGVADRQLQFYLSRVSEERRDQFREALTRSYDDLDPLYLYNFFRTPTGESMLQQIGTLIQLPGGIDGARSLRGALVGAALSPEGLSLLEVLKQFPIAIELDAAELIEATKRIEILATGTEIATDVMEQLTAAEAALDPETDYTELPDIRQLGPRGVVAETITLTDAERDRELYVNLYYPEQWREGSTPVVVMSHGLSSNPENFDKQARHLASYGYFVAAPQHPGSDLRQTERMLAGLSDVVFELDEFVDRPRDVSFVLDTLAARNASDYGDRLDLERVAAVGHSFGGYTVLALAGAQLNFESLETACGPRFASPNLSLLLQCRALELPRREYDLRDPRIVAVSALNPIASSLFSERGMGQVETPVAIYSGTYDPAAPAALEQIGTFPWLPDDIPQYLGVIEGQAHVDLSQLDAGVLEAIEAVPDVSVPPQPVFDDYIHATGLAFAEVHLLGNADYEPYLQASYANYISIEENALLWISEVMKPPLTEFVDTFEREARRARGRGSRPPVG